MWQNQISITGNCAVFVCLTLPTPYINDNEGSLSGIICLIDSGSLAFERAQSEEEDNCKLKESVFGDYVKIQG